MFYQLLWEWLQSNDQNLVCTMKTIIHHQWTSMNIEQKDMDLFGYGIFCAVNTQQTITVPIISLNFLCVQGKAYKPLGLKLKNSSKTSGFWKIPEYFVFILNFYFNHGSPSLINLPIICRIYTVKVLWNWEEIVHLTLKEKSAFLIEQTM